MRKTPFLLVLFALPTLARAQWWLGPPTYDYDPETPGIQAPRSTQPGAPLEQFLQRMFRASQVSFSLSVPLAELQAALPPGYVAQASPPGADTATVTVSFVLGQRAWTDGHGVSPPYSYAFFHTVAGRPPSGPERVILALEVASADEVAKGNALYGAGAVRLTELEEEVETEGAVTRFKLKVKDEGLGLDVAFSAECPGPIDGRVVTQLDPAVFRFVDGREPRAAVRHASQGDYRAADYAAARARYDVKGGYLALPGGTLRVLGFAPWTGVSFGRNLEFFRGRVAE